MNNPNVIPPKHINAVLILLSVNVIVKAVLNYDQFAYCAHINFECFAYSNFPMIDVVNMNCSVLVVSDVHRNLSSSAQVNNSYNTQSSGVDTELYEKSKYFTDTPM